MAWLAGRLAGSLKDEHAGLEGKYHLVAPIAAGGMATVYLGKVLGVGGFERQVAINPATGQVVTFVEHAVLANMEEVWLTTVDDGRVLLAGNTATGGLELALLAATPFDDQAAVDVVGSLQQTGSLAAPPAVRHGVVTIAREALNALERTELQLQAITVSQLEEG